MIDAYFDGGPWSKIDIYFDGGPWSGEVREFADPPEYIELEGGEYVATRLLSEPRALYAWLPLDPIEKFARDIERVAEANGYDGHRFREAA